MCVIPVPAVPAEKTRMDYSELCTMGLFNIQVYTFKKDISDSNTEDMLGEAL